jgi:hypothetical protein
MADGGECAPAGEKRRFRGLRLAGIAVLRFYAYNALLAEGAERGVRRSTYQRDPGYENL